jgi:hypothetical protein
MVKEVATVRFGFKERLMLFWRNLEVPVDFTASKTQIENMLRGVPGRRDEHPRFQRLPFHIDTNPGFVLRETAQAAGVY